MNKKTLEDLDFSEKKVLLRVDYNVPLNEKGEITDDNRIKATLPTIRKLLEKNASIIIATHIGRPKGEVVEELKTNIVSKKLGELLKKEVQKVDTVIEEEAKLAASNLKPGAILMLENVRFFPEEKNNDAEFSKQLASLADIYVNDGFAVCHREHASIMGVTKHLESAAGLLVEKELKTLSEVRDNPEKPLIVVMGGVKLETRIPMIEQFIEKADKILFGGAMVFTFLKAQGKEIGTSLIDEEFVETASELLKKYEEKLILPLDVVVAKELKEGQDTKTVATNEIPADKMGLDVGPATVDEYIRHCQKAKTIIWNGPFGAFETRPFQEATESFARGISELEAKTIIGGGDTAAAIAKAGLIEEMDFISTGGGASLTLLEGKALPGIEALSDK